MSGRKSEDKQYQLVVSVVSRLEDTDRVAMQAWAERMLAIQNNQALSASTKLRQMVGTSVSGGVPSVVIRQVWAATKEAFPNATAQFWGQRSLPAKLAMGGIAISLAAFGGQGAGIAALGGAVGIPLWVLFGAGGGFIGILYEELRKGR